MKLHDNTAFGRIIVIPRTTANLFESNSLVKSTRSVIRLPNFQKNLAAEAFEKRTDERPRYAESTISRRDRQIENFDLIVRNRSRDEKSDHYVANLRDTHVVTHRIPLRRLGTLALDRRDRGSILGARRADQHDYFFGA